MIRHFIDVVSSTVGSIPTWRRHEEASIRCHETLDLVEHLQHHLRLDVLQHFETDDMSETSFRGITFIEIEEVRFLVDARAVCHLASIEGIHGTVQDRTNIDAKIELRDEASGIHGLDEWELTSTSNVKDACDFPIAPFIHLLDNVRPP